MAQTFRITIDVAYREGMGDVTADEIRVHMAQELTSANFPGVIQGFILRAQTLEDGGALLRELTPNGHVLAPSARRPPPPESEPQPQVWRGQHPPPPASVCWCWKAGEWVVWFRSNLVDGDWHAPIHLARPTRAPGDCVQTETKA